MRLFALVCLSALACQSFAGAQEVLTFEVASVKASAPPDANGGVFIGPPRGGPGTSDPERITWSGATLMNMLMAAYEVKRYQVAGPDWLSADEERYRYDIAVKVPAGAAKEQIPAMWRNLLKDRFGINVHTESREFPADELTVAKGGPKFKETTLDPNAPPPPPGPVKLGSDGIPHLERAGMLSMVSPGPNGPILYLVGRATPLGPLTNYLNNQLRHPVTDKTGMTGKYDFVLEHRLDTMGRSISPALAAPAQGDTASEPGTDIGTALEQQLGLKLVKGKAPLPFIVVDHVEKTPTEN